METNKVNIAPPQIASEGRSAQPKQEATSQPSTDSGKSRNTAGLFITPVIQFDSETLSVIFRVRDGLSGEVKQEYPQQSVIKGRQATAEATARRMDVSSAPETETVEVAAPRVEASSSGGSEVRLGSDDTASSSGNEDNNIAASSAGIASGLGNA